MFHPVRISDGKGTILATQFSRYRQIVGTKIAQMQFIKRNIFRRGQRWQSAIVPIFRFECRVVAVNDQAACAVKRQGQRIGIGDNVRFHLAGAWHIDGEFIEIVFANPTRVAANCPRATDARCHVEDLASIPGGGVEEM